MINGNTLGKIQEFIKADKIHFTDHVIVSMLNHMGYIDKGFIINCLKAGRCYRGDEIYKEEDKNDILDHEKKVKRYYCMHKPNLLSRLIMISFELDEDILVIHISHKNKHSREGKIYYKL